MIYQFYVYGSVWYCMIGKLSVYIYIGREKRFTNYRKAIIFSFYPECKIYFKNFYKSMKLTNIAMLS